MLNEFRLKGVNWSIIKFCIQMKLRYLILKSVISVNQVCNCFRLKLIKWRQNLTLMVKIWAGAWNKVDYWKKLKQLLQMEAFQPYSNWRILWLELLKCSGYPAHVWTRGNGGVKNPKCGQFFSGKQTAPINSYLTNYVLHILNFEFNYFIVQLLVCFL